MLIPDRLSDMPLFKSKKEVYYYGSGDGSKSGRTAVSYYSSLEKNELLKKYIQYFKKQEGLTNISEKDKILFRFPEQQGVLIVKIKGDNSGNKITIENFGGY